MSDFCTAKALSGEWTHETWGLWNMISVTYMISSYLVFMGSSAYFILKHMALRDDWIWLVTCDVAIMSTWVFILLMLATCRHCADPEEIKKIEANKSGSGYNKIVDKNSSSLVEEALSKMPKPKPPPLNLKAIPPLSSSNRRINTFEREFSITEEEMNAPTSQRRNNQGSGRGGKPPALRNEGPKPLPPPKNDKIKSPNNKRGIIEEEKDET